MILASRVARYKLCPYCGGKHRLVKAFKACERRNRPLKWKKSPV